MLKKAIVFVVILAAILFTLAPKAASNADVGKYLLLEKAGQVVMLTHPDIYTTGGTGFELKLPSGRVYTISNAHVCAIAVNGLMGAHLPGSNRVVKIRVLDVSDKADLCLLEALPGASGLSMGDSQPERQHINSLGHPHLNPLTYSEGYLVGRFPVQIGEEIPKEQCTHKNEEFKEFPTMFGLIGVCMTTRDAFQTSMVIYPGNSGSPVFNDEGDVVGVVFAGMTSTNFASIVPLDLLREFVSVY